MLVEALLAEWHPLALACIVLLARLSSDEWFSEFASIDIASTDIGAGFDIVVGLAIGMAIPGDN
tara:strand:- start:583 stop:774 length:192 start_codon:yes stop_codon:yes gene_type:complete